MEPPGQVMKLTGRDPPLRSKRKNLPRVHDVFRVQRALDGAHHLHRAIARLGDQKIHLVQAYAVLASESSFQTAPSQAGPEN